MYMPPVIVVYAVDMLHPIEVCVQCTYISCELIDIVLCHD